MIIDLPKNFRFEAPKKGAKELKGWAEVRNGVLYIHGDVPFRRLMYDITYCLKGRTECSYCGRKMKKEEATLDHAYAQEMGGPTIPNNLEPCCAQCNSKKSNFSKEQYARLLLLDKADRRMYRKAIAKEQKLMRKNGMYNFPTEWLIQMSIQKFIVMVKLNKEFKGKEYSKVKDFYEEYGSLPRPIITDKNGFVLEGFSLLMLAKEEGLKLVPVIMLENVKVKVKL